MAKNVFFFVYYFKSLNFRLDSDKFTTNDLDVVWIEIHTRINDFIYSTIIELTIVHYAL